MTLNEKVAKPLRERIHKIESLLGESVRKFDSQLLRKLKAF